MHRRLAKPVAAVMIGAGLSLLAGCGGGGGARGIRAETATSSSPPATDVTTTVTAAPIGKPASGKAKDVRDWDGTRFDIGVLDRVDRTEDGRTLVVFDRMQLETDHGRRSGRDFTTEPIVFGNTDNPLVNDTARLRTYVAQPGVEVLRLANLRETCADLPHPAAPRWERVSVDRVIDGSLWNDYRQVSLTFSPEGYVSQVRLTSGC